MLTQREKGRDLTQSYDKSPYTNRNVRLHNYKGIDIDNPKSE